MSLEFSVKLSNCVINENDLLNEIRKYNKKAFFEFDIGKNIVEFNNIYDDLGFIIIVIKEKKPPYNFYDSELIKREFEYKQVVNFEFNKDKELITSYNLAIQIACSVISKYKTEALITSNFSEELCFIDNLGEIYVNKNISYINKQIFENIDDIHISLI